jgi:hypothetical protein
MKLHKAVRCAQPSKSVHCNVRFGSWLCENAKTLNRDRRSYSSKTVLVAQRASGFNLEIELKNIILRRVSIFEFLYSQGQSLPKWDVRATSAFPLLATEERTSPNVSNVPCVDGSGLASEIFTSQAWSVLPCVRPVDAVHMTAGHNALRGSGPDQTLAFDNAMARVGCPDRRIDRLCITCCSPPNLHITPVTRRDLVYRASATGCL